MIRPFVNAVAVGFAITAPVGPVGLLCIRRTLRHGMSYGLASGAGAATADATYGSIAAFGLTIISSALIRWTGWIELIGGALLCLIGLYSMRRHKADGTGNVDPGNLMRAGFGLAAMIRGLVSVS
jgi:threonine/homoserine/homoserine lactone efflux protein